MIRAIAGTAGFLTFMASAYGLIFFAMEVM